MLSKGVLLIHIYAVVTLAINNIIESVEGELLLGFITYWLPAPWYFK